MAGALFTKVLSSLRRKPDVPDRLPDAVAISRMNPSSRLALWRGIPVGDHPAGALQAILISASIELSDAAITNDVVSLSPRDLLPLACSASLSLHTQRDRLEAKGIDIDPLEDAIGSLSWVAACFQQQGAVHDLTMRLSSIDDPAKLDDAWFRCLRAAVAQSDKVRAIEDRASSQAPGLRTEASSTAPILNPLTEEDSAELDLAGLETTPPRTWSKHPPTTVTGPAIRREVAFEMEALLSLCMGGEAFEQPQLDQSTAWHLELAKRLEWRSNRAEDADNRILAKEAYACAIWIAVHDMCFCPHQQTRTEAVMLWEAIAAAGTDASNPCETPWLVDLPGHPVSDLMARRVANYLIAYADGLPALGLFGDDQVDHRALWGRLRSHLRSERAATDPDITRSLLRAVVELGGGDHAWASAAWLLCAQSQVAPDHQADTALARGRNRSEQKLMAWIEGLEWTALLATQGVPTHHLPAWRTTSADGADSHDTALELTGRLQTILARELPNAYGSEDWDEGVHPFGALALDGAAQAVRRTMREVSVGEGLPPVSPESQRRIRCFYECLGVIYWLQSNAAGLDVTDELSRHRGLDRDLAGTFAESLMTAPSAKPSIIEPFEAAPTPETIAPVQTTLRSVDRGRLIVPMEGSAQSFSETNQFCAVLTSPMRVAAWPDAHTLTMTLAAEFPWAEELIEALRSELLLAERVSGRRAERLPPLCLIGPGGVGKSRIARRITEIVKAAGGPGGATLNLGGASDNRTLAGTARGWSNAYPTFPSTVMARTKCPNPLLVIEELDKAGGEQSRGGTSHDTLLAMLDPSTAGVCLDEGLGAKVDFSLVSWIMTANHRDKIPALLRQRLRFVQIPPPRSCDFDILLSGCLSDVAKEFGGEVESLPIILPEVVEAMRHGYQSGGLTARGMAKVVKRALTAGAEADLSATRH